MYLLVAFYFVLFSLVLRTDSVHPCQEVGDIPRYSSGLGLFICYHDFGNHNEDVDDADPACNAWKPEYNAHLLSFHGDDEINWVENEIRDGIRMWCGLKKVDNSILCPESPGVENDYYWTDGSSTAYIGEFGTFDCIPAGPPGEGFCFYFRYDADGHFHDRRCDQVQDFKRVCSYLIPQCNGVSGHQDELVCNGRGECHVDNMCACNEPDKFYGNDCEFFRCYDVEFNHSTVCSGHGKCTSLDNCVCDPGFYGLNCSFATVGVCSGPNDEIYNETDCSGNGERGCCYRDFGSGDSFHEAEAFCEDWHDGGHLLTLHSGEEMTWVSDKFSSGGGGDVAYWTGLKKRDYSSPCPTINGYNWTDSSSVSFANTLSVSCDDNSTNCLGMEIDTTNFFDETCSNSSLSTICKYLIHRCSGVLSSDTTRVCSGRGECLNENNCSCVDDYSGDNCQYFYCHGLRYDDPEACSSPEAGTCIGPDECECHDQVYGVHCNVTQCFTILSNDPTVCWGKGDCVSYDTCECTDPMYTGEECQYTHACAEPGDTEFEGFCYHYYDVESYTKTHCLTTCRSWWFRSDMISIHSSSQETYVDGLVGGSSMWFGLEKNEGGTVNSCPPTNGYRFTDGRPTTYVTSGPPAHTISCNEDALAFVFGTEWYDSENFHIHDCGCMYEIPTCFNISSTNIGTVCSGKGWCFDADNCSCYDPDNYLGKTCNITYCQGTLLTNEQSVCMGHGTCWPLDVCSCEGTYFGNDCQFTVCNGILSNYTDDVCSDHGTCWPENNCNCELDEGYHGLDCDEFVDPTWVASLNSSSSEVFLPIRVPVDTNILFSRRSEGVEDLEDGGYFDCDVRVPNYRDFLGPSGDPAALCRWKIDAEEESFTEGLFHRINYDSPIYDTVPDGTTIIFGFDVHLLTKDKNVTIELIRNGAVQQPRRYDDDDDDDGNGGIIIAGVAGGLTAGLLALIVILSICSCICLGLCIVCCLVVCTLFGGCGILGVVISMGMTGGTTAAAGAAGVVVGKEVHDEVMDEGPDLIKEAVKERWNNNNNGEKDTEMMDFERTEESEPKFITDNLEEAIRQKDDDLIDPDEGLDVLKKEDSDSDGDGEGSDEISGIALESEEELSYLKKKEEKKRELKERKREKERLELQKRREEEEKVRNFSVEEEMKDIREKAADEEIGLSLSTKYARKRKKKVEKKLEEIEEDLKRKEKKMKKKLEKEEGGSLSLRKFEKRKRKEKREGTIF